MGEFVNFIPVEGFQPNSADAQPESPAIPITEDGASIDAQRLAEEVSSNLHRFAKFSRTVSDLMPPEHPDEGPEFF